MNILTRDTVRDHLTWAGVMEALRDGHSRPRARIGDQFLTRDQDTLLSRAAWIDGLGFGVKSVSVMPHNAEAGVSTIDGAMLVFEDVHGRLEAIVDSDLVTEWKTAGDSVLGAKLLARKDCRRLLIVGAGVVAETLVRAYCEIFPDLESIDVWGRSASKAEAFAAKMAARGFPVGHAPDLPDACLKADIVSAATMAKEPVIRGEWIAPGTHVDLIGAFKADMREADDGLLQKGRVFVDCIETTVDHIGELMIPLADGTILREDVLGDLYDLVPGRVGRLSDDDITIFKNGGGAHLDLMTAKHILSETI